MKKFVLFCISIFLGWTAFAETTFSLKGAFSVLYGQQGEYVYNRCSENGIRRDILLSRLDWELKPLYFFGIDFGANVNRFVFSAGTKFAIPMSCGIMADSDWRNVEFSPLPPKEKRNIKTNYSESDNSVELSFDVNVFFGYKFSPTNFITLTPFVEVEYEYNLMCAWGMIGIYGKQGADGYFKEWNGVGADPKYSPPSERNVSLERFWITSWVGLDSNFAIGEKFSIGLSLAFSPLIWCNSFDCHYLRSAIFNDKILGFFSGGKIGLNFNWIIAKKNIISLGFDAQGTLIMKGKTYSGSIGSKLLIEDTSAHAGADFKYVELKLSYTRKF